ncbi:MAG: ABC transporter ATP-binding protein [bacterium]
MSEDIFSIPKKLVPFIWYFLKRHTFKIACLLLVSVVLAFDLSVRPYMMKLIIDGVAKYEPNMGSLVIALLFPILGYLASMAVLILAFRFYDAVRLFMLPQIQADITSSMLAYVEFQSHSFFQDNMSGSIASQIKEMSQSVKEIIKITINKFFAHFLSLLIASVTLFTVHPLLALILISWTVFFLVISVMLSKKSGALAEVLSGTQNQVTGKIVDSLSNVMTVRLFTQHQREMADVRRALDEQVKAGKKLEWCMLKIRTIQSLSVFGMVALLLVVLLYARQNSAITIGDFALTISLALSISEIISNISEDFVTFSESVGRCKQALKLINIEHKIIDLPRAHVLKNVRGEIIFDSVNFAFYGQQNIFSNLSVKIEQNQKVGIVGFSGAGKSTFVNLITRIFDVQTGSILVDGYNVKNVTQQSLRQNISFIPQETILFHRSFKENIAYGLDSAAESEIIWAAKKTYAHDFILSTEYGYDTVVGERGIKISGGQRQRIAIARAFLKNAPILIMDEATSALDSQTEKCIQDSFATLMQNKTVIVIAHRLSTLMSMDRILVFDQGQIVEDGTHNELIKNSSVYTKLWNTQVGGFI